MPENFLKEELFGSRVNSEILRANKETARILKDHNKYVNTLGSQVQTQTLKNHTNFLKKSKQEDRRRKCQKKQAEKQLKMKLQSHEKMVRDQIANYVRKM